MTSRRRQFLFLISILQERTFQSVTCVLENRELLRVAESQVVFAVFRVFEKRCPAHRTDACFAYQCLTCVVIIVKARPCSSQFFETGKYVVGPFRPVEFEAEFGQAS